MKKIISVLIAAALVLSCTAASALFEAEPDLVSPAEGGELELFPSSMTLPMFSTSSGERLRVFFDGELISPAGFEWSSSDESVVTVDQVGALTPAAPGSAVISITAGDMYAEALVTVVEDELFTTVDRLEAIDLELPFYSEEVGIGPLCGAQPVILKRFIHNPGCGSDPQPDPDEYTVSEGWTYSYAVVYRVHMSYGQSVRFVASASDAAGMHASNAYLCIYDQFFNLWSYSGGSYSAPYGDLTLDSYEDSDFYVVITPGSHTDDAQNGFITLYAYDLTQPYAPGDVDMDHYVSASDGLLVLRYSLDIISLDEASLAHADVNSDGSVGSDDALIILRMALGID